jgi:hypothetical protein
MKRDLWDEARTEKDASVIIPSPEQLTGSNFDALTGTKCGHSGVA